MLALKKKLRFPNSRRMNREHLISSSFVRENNSWLSSSGSKPDHKRVIVGGGDGSMEKRCKKSVEDGWIINHQENQKIWDGKLGQSSKIQGFLPSKSKLSSEFGGSKEKVLKMALNEKEAEEVDQNYMRNKFAGKSLQRCSMDYGRRFASINTITKPPLSQDTKMIAAKKMIISSFDGEKTSSAAKKRRLDQEVIVGSDTPMEKRHKKSLKDSWNHQENLKVGDEKTSGQRCSKTQLLPKSTRVLPNKSKLSESEKKVNLKIVLKMPKNATAVEQVEVPKPTKNCARSKRSSSNGRSQGSLIDAKPPLSQGTFQRNSCGSIKGQCSLIPSNSNRASSKTSSEDLRGGNAAGASRANCQGQMTLISSQLGKSDADNGAVSVCTLVHESTICLTPKTTDPTKNNALLTPALDVQMSPQKAQRAAMLKARFADTIQKAQQMLQLVRVEKSADQETKQQGKEELERRLREEEAKVVEAERKAAEALAKINGSEFDESKRQLEKKREAARIALQNMENSAGIEPNLEIEKELEILSGGSLSYRIPLHQLRLFFKDEYFEDDDDED